MKGTQPIIVALARGLKEKIEPEFVKPMEQGRLLIISPFEKEIKRMTTATAMIRNKGMIEIADQIAIGFVSPNGQLSELLKFIKKPVSYIS